MELGRHLRELSRLRFGVAACLLIATFAALSTSFKISLVPPKLEQRSLQMATASTEIFVDTPTSLVLDLRQNTADIESLTNRAVLIGNVMASPPVRAYIGRRAGVPADAVKTTTPRTPNSPRPLETAGNKKTSADLLASTDQYRLDIESNPTVPMLNVYAQAPSAKAAGELANAAVDGLRDYLTQVATSQGIPPGTQVRVEQLGRARGKVINSGVNLQASGLAFLFFFAISAAAAIFISRVRRGFELAGGPGSEAAPPPGPAPARAEVDCRPAVLPDQRAATASRKPA
jgi:hypothetical protein